MKELVLKAMKEAGKPVSAGDITKILNADRKEVDKAFADLKKKAPSSPRCAANGNLPSNHLLSSLNVPPGIRMVARGC